MSISSILIALIAAYQKKQDIIHMDISKQSKSPAGVVTCPIDLTWAGTVSHDNLGQDKASLFFSFLLHFHLITLLLIAFHNDLSG